MYHDDPQPTKWVHLFVLALFVIVFLIIVWLVGATFGRPTPRQDAAEPIDLSRVEMGRFGRKS